MVDSTPALSTTDLLAREAIRDVLTRYCRAADRRDRELMRSVYWPDAHDDHGAMFRGNAYDFVDLAMAGGRFEITQHLLGQSTIVLAAGGASAKVETYAFAYHRLPAGDLPAHDVMVGARLFDRFEHRDGEWRIAWRRLVMDWFKTFADADDVAAGVFGGQWTMGSKNMADLSYDFFADGGGVGG